jgi:hypothetical protein
VPSDGGDAYEVGPAQPVERLLVLGDLSGRVVVRPGGQGGEAGLAVRGADGVEVQAGGEGTALTPNHDDADVSG